VSVDLELVDVAYSAIQNKSLTESFRTFYKLDSSPEIKKVLVVEKSEYNRFLKSRTKARTQFESTPSEIDLSFNERTFPFMFIATKTEFVMPSKKNVVLYEELDSPCGLTKKVTSTYGDEKLEFQSYFQAEGYALAKYLEEIKVYG
jgi:hypothetical protein